MFPNELCVLYYLAGAIKLSPEKFSKIMASADEIKNPTPDFLEKIKHLQEVGEAYYKALRALEDECDDLKKEVAPYIK